MPNQVISFFGGYPFEPFIIYESISYLLGIIIRNSDNVSHRVAFMPLYDYYEIIINFSPYLTTIKGMSLLIAIDFKLIHLCMPTMLMKVFRNQFNRK